jgi:hypothetical protein
MSFDSITNRGDYLSPHYLAEKLPQDLKGKGGLRARWTEREKAAEPTPVRELRGLRREYFDKRLVLKDRDDSDQPREREARAELRKKEIIGLNGPLLRALGYVPEPRELAVDRAGETYAVPVAYAGQNVVAIDCEWATDTDAAFDAEGAGQLLTPVETGSRETIETGAKLARWLFAADEPPRYVLLLHGGVIVLADRLTWGEGRYLAVSLDIALDRNDAAELEVIAALFSADALQPPPEGGEEALAAFVNGSRQHTVGVSAELREGLRESVQIIANEVLDRLHQQGAKPGDIDDGTLAKDLGRQSLRYLYRILFLLYAEARPELGILPVDDEDYMAGYSMARLGDLIARRLGGEEARKSFHLHESLAVLFRMVNDGHRPRGAGETGAELAALSEGEGLRFEALKADLFDPTRTRLIGTLIAPGYDAGDPDAPRYDTRLRDAALYRVLRRLMLSKGGAGRGRGRGRTERGGFISYAQLGISQLGAVYEGLMSYTGFIADEKLYEVAKPDKDKQSGDPSDGSWMIGESKIDDYPDNVFVKVRDENGFLTGERVIYPPGSFVYRLAGRDRQTSASYYTPQSLTSVTVQLALEQRIKEQENAEDGSKVTAAEVLRWRICEPALGSGAFLNEAVDQVAALYLRLREEETGERLEPEERALALQRVKAFVALHNCYGVDLNETAVELAEVSIWLNVMHRGLQAPWFGLHLVRGNSLIGAGRRLYPAYALTAKETKEQWLNTAPVDHPFSAGAIPSGHVHHFLLPAAGWGAVAGEKEARELAPDEAKQLAAWRRQIRKPATDKKTKGHKLTQLQRLQALSARAEYLWSLVTERLRISEQEISRPIKVWGAADLPHPKEAIPRDEIVRDLTLQGTPYWRLKTVMDAWCALWFWPLDKTSLLDGTAEVYADKSPAIAPPVEPAPVDPDPNFPTVWEMDSLWGETPKQLTLAEAAPKKPPRPKPAAVVDTRPVPLASLDNWLDFAEALLGRQDVAADSLASDFTSLKQMEEYEDKLESEFYMHMDPVNHLVGRFPWLGAVEKIAADQGFFHWELRFASVFAEGGFDLQVGNPPWVRPEWDESGVLAELEPWFELTEKPPASVRASRISQLLASEYARDTVLIEHTAQAATSVFMSSVSTYALLDGTRPDFYRAFMSRAWRNIGSYGTVGLLHPDTHFVGDREKHLRAAAYARLRIHGDFVNSGNRFFPPPVNRSSHFGMHIYGRPKKIRFVHLGWLLSATELPQSLALAEAGESPAEWDSTVGRPGVKYGGDWDARPHRDRVVWVDDEMLASWRLISGSGEDPLDEVKLLNLVTVQEQGAISALGQVKDRLGSFHPQVSGGYNETNAVKNGLIRWETWDPPMWSEVILKGPQIGVATPFFKQPPNTGTKGRPQDLTILPDDALPRSEYARATDIETYVYAQDRWRDAVKWREIADKEIADPTALAEGHRPYTEFYRLAWRRMIPDDTDRSLFPAIYPPGPAHVHSVHTLALPDNRGTALTAGFWSGIPLDYYLRITATTDLQTTNTLRLPAPLSDHPLASPLLLRTLSLNCLTTAYAELWQDLYEDAWCNETWVVDWPNIAPLGTVGPTWQRRTPLRTEYERRAALVEIDALVAVWLGITEEQLEAIYPARYPVLGDYEDVTWFDANGRKIAGNWNTFGTGQTKEHWEQFQLYREDPKKNPAPDGYTAPFYKADRIAEYRQAHAAFSARLAAATKLQGSWQQTEGDR